MKLFLVRHGETDWNLTRRYQSYSDVPLNQNGIQQAQALAKRLAKEKIDAICSSDLSRTMETAKWIANEYEPIPAIQCDPRWRELSFGKWDGLNHEEIQAGWQTEVNAWYADPLNVSPPNGETMLQLLERVQAALDELQSKHKDETVLIVSHGGTIQVLLCMLLGVDLNRYWQFHVKPAALTEIHVYEVGAILEVFNDTNHLKVLE
jgi:alpha-ribazole phosphatase